MDVTQPAPRLPLTLVIDPDPAARALVARVVHQLGGAAIEAADALSGLDLVNEHDRSLSMIVLDVRLPDLDGYDLCVRLRKIATQRAVHFKVLPYTNTGVMEMLLDELGCARPCFKPATPEQLATAIRRALETPARPLPATPLTALVHQHALLAEQQARQERALRVALLAASLPVRLGLAQLLTGAGARVLMEHGDPDVLRHFLSRQHAHVLVADASERQKALDLAASQALPLLIVATARDDLPTVAGDRALLEKANGVVDLTGDDAPFALSKALAIIARGERIVALPQDGVILGQGEIVPAGVNELLADAGLTARERQVLWLDSHLWSTLRIAGRLGVNASSVDSYWKRIQRKLQRDRDGVREWFKAQLGPVAPATPAAPSECEVGSKA